MAKSSTPVRGVGFSNNKENSPSEGASAVEKFGKIIPDYVEDDTPLFGRAPENTRVTVGDFRNPASLKEKIGNYVKDLRRSVNDEHVVKVLEGRTITVGDLRDYAGAESAPESPNDDPNTDGPDNKTITAQPDGGKTPLASDAPFGKTIDASGNRDVTSKK